MVDDVILALDEACSNVVKHAFPTGRGMYTLRADLRPEEVVIEVEDDGVGFDPMTPQRRWPAGPRRPGPADHPPADDHGRGRVADRHRRHPAVDAPPAPVGVSLPRPAPTNLAIAIRAYVPPPAPPARIHRPGRSPDPGPSCLTQPSGASTPATEDCRRQRGTTRRRRRSRRVLAAMGAEGSEPPPPASVIITSPDRPPVSVGAGRLDLEDGATLQVDGLLPPGLPFGYHRFVPRDGGPGPQVIVSPGVCRLPGPADVGLGRPALRRPVGGQLGHRRPGRPAAAGGLVGRAGRRHGPGQPAARRPAGEPAAAEPVLRQQPVLPQPPVPADRGAARGRRAARPGRPGRGRAGPSTRTAASTATRCGGSSRPRSRRSSPRFAGDADFDRFCHEQGEALAGLRHLLRPGRALRLPMGKVAGRRAPARRRRDRRRSPPAETVPRRIRYHSWLQWLLDGQLAARGADRSGWSRTSPSASTPAAPTPGCGRTASPSACGSGPRPTSSTPWARTGACRRSIRGGCAPAGYEPFIQTVRAGLPPRRRAAVRPCHGPVPAVLDPRGRHAGGRHLRPLPVVGPARHPGPREPPGRRLRGRRGPGHGRGRSSARSWTSAACCPTGCCGSSPSRPDRGAWPEQALAAVTTHDLPTVAGLWTGADLAAQRALGLAPNEEAVLRHPRQGRGLDRRRTTTRR